MILLLYIGVEREAMIRAVLLGFDSPADHKPKFKTMSALLFILINSELMIRVAITIISNL